MTHQDKGKMPVVLAWGKVVTRSTSQHKPAAVEGHLGERSVRRPLRGLGGNTGCPDQDLAGRSGSTQAAVMWSVMEQTSFYTWAEIFLYTLIS